MRFIEGSKAPGENMFIPVCPVQANVSRSMVPDQIPCGNAEQTLPASQVTLKKGRGLVTPYDLISRCVLKTPKLLSFGFAILHYSKNI